MSGGLFQWFLVGLLLTLADFVIVAESSDYKRIETVNQVAKMVDLVSTNRESPQTYNPIWFLICIYASFIGCFCLGCFGFVIKQYNDYKVYIKEINYMNNRA